MVSRTQSIRTKIAVLLIVPLASLVGLWTFATMITYGDSTQMLNARTSDKKLVKPAQNLVVSLQHERRMSMAFLGARTLDRSGLEAQRVKTDETRRTYRSGVHDGKLRGIVEPEVRAQMDELDSRLGEIDVVRRLVDQRGLPRKQVLGSYSGLIDGVFEIYKAATPDNAQIARDTDNLIRLGRARELLTREDALVTGVLAAGRWLPGELDEFEELHGAHHLVLSDVLATLAPADRARYQELRRSPMYHRFHELEEDLAEADESIRKPPLDLGSWHTASEAYIERELELENQALDDTTERARDEAVGVFVRLGLAGGLGLIAVIASAAVAWRVSRRLVRESRTVATAVGDFTTGYLPALTESVRGGGRIDADSALPKLDLRVTEIAQISESFTEAGRAVIEATTREIEARRGVSEVFVTLARRNQALLHRQLSLLDTMERRSEDPSELDDLFRLDHLATRMRRHAEGLVILAGKTAGRSWRTPVPLVDVVRGAVAEVEDYTRVRVQQMPGSALAGNTVADTIHLLAELIENATLFSPPQSPVQVSGQLVPNGFVVEIEDRGLGLKAETLDELNARLIEPPEFDLSDLGRLGLFVVARLAERHGVKVALRASPYGGTTAIVLIPSALIVEAPTSPLPTAEAFNELPAPLPVLADRLPPDPSREPAPTAAPGELPQRRRQTNLVPQLQAQPNGQASGNGRTPTDAVPVEPCEGLPQRRRQGSLTPEPSGPQEAQEAPGEEVVPEAVRTKMAAMQRGWQQGRADAEQDSGTQEDGL